MHSEKKKEAVIINIYMSNAIKLCTLFIWNWEFLFTCDTSRCISQKGPSEYFTEAILGL